MDGLTLITQHPGYPEERPEIDDMGEMLEHLANELEGKQMLEKPRVSKKVMVLALKEQNRIIGQLRREANSNFMLLDDRSRQTQDLVQTLVGKIEAKDNQLKRAQDSIVRLQGEVKQVTGKFEKALELIDVEKNLEDRMQSVQQRVETHNAKLDMHEERFEEMDVLTGRIKLVEEAVENISGDKVFVETSHMGETSPLNTVVQNIQGNLKESQVKIHEQTKIQRQQSENMVKTEILLEERVRGNKEIIDEIQHTLDKNGGANLAEIQQEQTTLVEQLDVIKKDLLVKIDKSYVDEHVEARYEEIINHLHRALSSTEEDERDFKRRASRLQDIIEQLSADKADRRELLELKHFMTSLNGHEQRSSTERRRPSSGALRRANGNPLTGAITRDEVFNMLEEKVDRKDLERRISALVTRVNNVLIRNGNNIAIRRGHSMDIRKIEAGTSAIGSRACSTGPVGPNGYGGTPAKRGGSGVGLGFFQGDGDVEDWATWESDPEGPLAISKQLTDGFGKAVTPDGIAVGTCLSCKAPVVHPDKIDLFPGLSRGGGFQLWSPGGKGPPLRGSPGGTLPELDVTEGRHIIGKDGNLYLAQMPGSAGTDVMRLEGSPVQRPQTADG